MGTNGTSTILMLVVMIAIFYFLMIRPESKRKKAAEQMRNSLKKGDVITTIGGVVGRIVTVTENTIIIETSEDRVRMEFTKWAVSNTGVQASTEPQKSKKEEKKLEETTTEESVDEIPQSSDEMTETEETKN